MRRSAKSLYASCFFVLLFRPAVGQVVDAIPQISPASSDKSIDAQPVASENAKLWLDFKLAPTFDNDLLKSNGDRLSEFQTTSLALAYKSSFPPTDRISTALVFTAAAALKADTDFDKDSPSSTTPSALVGDMKLTANRGFRRISPFLAYRFEAGFDRFLESHRSTDNAVSLGADIPFVGRLRCKPGEDPRSTIPCTGLPVFTVSVLPSIERVASSKSSNDRWSARLGLKATGSLVGRVNWETTGNIERRMFDDPNPTTGLDREWRFIGFAGIDFAEAIEPAHVFLQELKLGVRLNRVDRAGPNDRSNLQALPVLRISVPLGT